MALIIKFYTVDHSGRKQFIEGKTTLYHVICFNMATFEKGSGDAKVFVSDGVVVHIFMVFN